MSRVTATVKRLSSAERKWTDHISLTASGTPRLGRPRERGTGLHLAVLAEKGWTLGRERHIGGQGGSKPSYDWI